LKKYDSAMFVFIRILGEKLSDDDMKLIRQELGELKMENLDYVL
jgi:hypothetical protein